MLDYAVPIPEGGSLIGVDSVVTYGSVIMWQALDRCLYYKPEGWVKK